MDQHPAKTSRALSALGLLTVLLAVSLLAPLADAGLPQREFFITPVDEQIYNGQRGGFEPHILAGPSVDGEVWYYYDSPSGLVSPGARPRIPGNFWISKDFGLSWTYTDKGTLPGLGASGDTFTAISAEGTIYFTDLYGASASVDTSTDGGDTWYANPVASEYLIDDRQWLDIGPARDGASGQTLYFGFNNAAGLVMVRTDMVLPAAYDWVTCNNGAVITTDVRARDNFAVDEETGIIYVANYAPGAGEIQVLVSDDGCDSFTTHTVTSASGAEAQNIFTVVDTDIAGNVYVTWSSRDQMWLAVSTDQAESWSIYQVTNNTSVKALPWVSAGDAGRVGIAWYESEPGRSGTPDEQTDSWWDLKVAVSLYAAPGANATEAPAPSFDIFTVDPQVHYGGVQTTGTGGGSDRDLGDYLTVDVDPYGRLLIAYGNDRDDGGEANSKMSYPMFAGQLDGPFLRENSGPQIKYSLSKEGRKVYLDLTGTNDPVFLLDNITVNWGDNTSWVTTTFDDFIPTHSYPNRKATYDLTIQVTNAIGMRTTLVVEVTIEVEEEGLPAWALPLGALLVLAAVGTAYVLGKREPKEELSKDEAAGAAEVLEAEQ